jgi:hypothetical protein
MQWHKVQLKLSAQHGLLQQQELLGLVQSVFMKPELSGYLFGGQLTKQRC